MLRLLVIASLAACTFARPGDITFSQTSISIRDGDGQEGIVGTALAKPLIANVTDADLRPLANFTVEFTIVEGEGVLSEERVRTDAQGNALTELTLGTRVGANTVQATGEGIQGEPARFEALGLVGPVATVVKVAGDGADAVVASSIELVARAEDQYGNPVPDRTVELAADAGDTLSVTTAITSATGEAGFTLTLGTAARSRSVSATIDGVTATFAIVGVPDAPAQVLAESGDDGVGTALLPMSPFVAKVADQHGNPVAGVTVGFVRTLGAGVLDTASAITNSAGLAEVVLTPSNLDEVNRVEARVAGLTAVGFDATTRGFRSAQNVNISPGAVAIGDVDGDSRPDLIVSSGSTLRVHLNRTSPGAITASFVTTFITPAEFVNALAVGDIDGDGRADLALLGRTRIDVLLSTTAQNASEATYAAPLSVVTEIDFGFTSRLAIALADLDGDNLPDLVFQARILVIDDSVTPHFARNTTAGSIASFAAPQSFGTMNLTDSIAVGDLDGDDKPEVVLGSSPVRIFRNTSENAVLSFSALGSLDVNSVETAIGDVNGDGKLDLVFGVRAGTPDQIKIARNITATLPEFATPVSFDEDEFGGVAITDLNGDGKADVVTGVRSSNGRARIRLSKGSTAIAFTDPIDYPINSASAPGLIQVVDLNDDGRPDVLGATSNGLVILLAE